MNGRCQLCGCEVLVHLVYELSFETIVKKEVASVAAEKNKEIDIWHQCLEYLNVSHLNEAIKQKL